MMTVASFILRKGVVKAGKKYAPKLINQAKQYIKKNKLILSGNKVIKPKKSQIKTVRPTNKKPTTTKKINPNKNQGKPTTGTTKPGTASKNTKPTTGTTKPGTRGKNTKPTTGTTKPGTKSKIPALIIGAGTLGGGAMIIKSGGDKGEGGSGMTFNQAFAKARKEKGKLSTFSYKGKMYSTATMDDVKKAGFDNLKDYLNSKKNK
jgi:hypothetical protein